MFESQCFRSAIHEVVPQMVVNVKVFKVFFAFQDAAQK